MMTLVIRESETANIDGRPPEGQLPHEVQEGFRGARLMDGKGLSQDRYITPE
jgi:hypothetical protein